MQKKKTTHGIFLLVAILVISATVLGLAFKEEVTFSPDKKSIELAKRGEKSSIPEQSLQIASAQGLPPPPGEDQLLVPVATHLFDLYAQSATRCGQFTETKVADLDNDGAKEIVAAFHHQNSLVCTFPKEIPSIYVWDNQGNLKAGFPLRLTGLNTPALEAYLSIVGIGDVTGDNKLEIVVTTGRGSPTQASGGTYIISSTGQILNHLEPNRGFSGIDRGHAVLTDLDNNGKLEIIARSLEPHPTDPNSGRKIFAWYGNGNAYPGWPATINPPGISNILLTEPAVVDFDGNGVKTIIFTSKSSTGGMLLGEVIALNNLGTVQWTNNLGNYELIYSPVIGDVDGDKEYEIVVFATKSIQPFNKEYFILDKNGVIEYQWSLNQYLNGAGGGIQTTLADLDRDNTLEIITKDDRYVYVYDHLGNIKPGFPRVIYEGGIANPAPCSSIPSNAPNYCPPGDFGTADLDNDGYLDIYGVALNTYRTGAINSHQYGFFAIGRFGTAVTGYPYPLNNYQAVQGDSYIINHQPTYTDIDNNGIGDILVSKGWGAIEVFSTNSPYVIKTAVDSIAGVPCAYASEQYGFDLHNTKVTLKCS